MSGNDFTVQVTLTDGVVTVNHNPAPVYTNASPQNVVWQFMAGSAATSVQITWVSKPPFNQTTQPNPPLGPWRTDQPTADEGDFTYQAQFLQNGKVIGGGNFVVRKQKQT